MNLNDTDLICVQVANTFNSESKWKKLCDISLKESAQIQSKVDKNSIEKSGQTD